MSVWNLIKKKTVHVNVSKFDVRTIPIMGIQFIQKENRKTSIKIHNDVNFSFLNN